jgi:hypothetical protein
MYRQIVEICRSHKQKAGIVKYPRHQDFNSKDWEQDFLQLLHHAVTDLDRPIKNQSMRLF